jgi:hypothetical protein
MLAYKKQVLRINRPMFSSIRHNKVLSNMKQNQVCWTCVLQLTTSTCPCWLFTAACSAVKPIMSLGACVCMQVYVYAYMYKHTHTHTHTCIKHRRGNSQVYMYAYMCTNTHIHAQSTGKQQPWHFRQTKPSRTETTTTIKFIMLHMRTRIHANMCTPTEILYAAVLWLYTHKSPHYVTHTHTRTHCMPHTHTHTRAHTMPHKHTHARTVTEGYKNVSTQNQCPQPDHCPHTHSLSLILLICAHVTHKSPCVP